MNDIKLELTKEQINVLFIFEEEIESNKIEYGYMEYRY